MAQFLRVNCDIDSAVGSFGRRVWRAASNEERSRRDRNADTILSLVVGDEKNDSGEIQDYVYCDAIVYIFYLKYFVGTSRACYGWLAHGI